MQDKSKIKPLTIVVVNDLHHFYWLKAELIKFCKEYKLSTQGSKLDLIKRIENFLLTRIKINYQPIKKTGDRDSLYKITKQTPVLNYNNDSETRKFFVDQIGSRFKFNSYLRQFTNRNNIKTKLTYGDLVDGWILFENKRKNNGMENSIPQQFEYNQFIKDYFYYEKSGTLKKAITAWNIVKSQNGPNTYDYFNVLKTTKHTR